MTTTTLKTRIQHKYDTPAKWAEDTSFVPLKGEICIFNNGTGVKPEMKIGDGITTLASLPFLKAGGDITVSRSLTSGTKIATITIDGVATDLYCQTNTDTTYSAGTGLSLSGTTFSLNSSAISFPHKKSWNFNENYDSNFVTFDASSPEGGPGGWINGLVTTHNSYLSSFLVNEHRTANWWVGYSEHSSTASVLPTWYKLLHSNNYADFTVKKDGTGASGTWDINITGAAKKLTNSDCGDLTWLGDHLLVSGSRPNASLHFGVNTLYQYRDNAHHVLLDTGNYTSYIPTKTGSGASGTWGINITGSSASCTGNAVTATKLATARTISLTGSVTGSGSFDGSGNLSIATTTNHTHSYLPLSGNAVSASAVLNSANTSEKLYFHKYSFTKTLTVSTAWINTGIQYNNLKTGSYIVQLKITDSSATSQYSECYTGVMSWYEASTNSDNTDEILLHAAGHARNNGRFYLRIARTPGNVSPQVSLQIKSNKSNKSCSYSFQFIRLLG